MFAGAADAADRLRLIKCDLQTVKLAVAGAVKDDDDRGERWSCICAVWSVTLKAQGRCSAGAPLPLIMFAPKQDVPISPDKAAGGVE